MKKSSVIHFFILLILIVIGFSVVRYYVFGGLTGFAVSDKILNESSSLGFNSQLVRYDIIGNKMFVHYVLDNREDVHKEVSVIYSISKYGKIIGEGTDSVILGALDNEEFILSFELPKDSFGEIELALEFSNSEDFNTISYNIYLSKDNITGLAISDSNKQFVSTFIFIVLSFFLIYSIFKFFNKQDSFVPNYETRKLIKLDIK